MHANKEVQRMSMQPEHKPHPWDRVAAENSKAARFSPGPHLMGIDPSPDAEGAPSSARPRSGTGLLSQRVPLTDPRWDEPEGV